MSQKTLQISFFSVLTLGFSVLSFFIFKPYLGVIFISGVLSVVFYPLYKKLVEKFKNKRSLASLVTTFLILIFIIIPVVLLSASLLKEAVSLYNKIALGNESQGLIAGVDLLIYKIGSFLPVEMINPSISLESYVRSVLNWIIGHFDSIFVVIFGGIFHFFLMLLSLYYLFIYGDKIKKGLVYWSPLPDLYDEEFIQTLKSAINAVLRGRLLVSMVQGFFIGIGFYIFGVGSPVLWGFVGGIASLVPMLGTSVITIPAVVYLFLSGHVGAGIGLLIWATLAVGLIDNALSMLFLKNKIKVHPLIVLFSILGGVEVFGAIGFLVGPVVVSTLLSLMKIYPFLISYKDKQLQT